MSAGTKASGNAPNLPEIHDFLISIASKAGEIITNALPEVGNADTKKNSADPVTQYDKAVENLVSTELSNRYPNYKFHGEETYDPAHPLTDDPTFVVDPIDGTVNFIHGFPQVCISLGFAVNRSPVVGVVYNPFTQTLYSAIRGQGAFLNRNTRLPFKSDRLEPLSGLSGALIAVEWGSERDGNNWDTKVRTFQKLGRTKETGGAMVHSMRSLGSAALNLCNVASGTLDLYWEGGCWAWDVCAAWLILVEAGGIIVDGNPGNWEASVDGRKYLAVRASPEGKGQKELVKEFWDQIEGRLQY